MNSLLAKCLPYLALAVTVTAFSLNAPAKFAARMKTRSLARTAALSAPPRELAPSSVNYPMPNRALWTVHGAPQWAHIGG
jgi:hypothetical protein